MSDKVTTVIVSVTPTTVNTKRGPAVKHTILTSSGAELQTFKQDIAQTAMSLLGQQVEIEYDVSINGDFTNFYPVAILPASNPALQAQMAQQAMASMSQGAQFAGQVAQQATPKLPTGDYFAEPKTVSIHRQKATDVATKLITEGTTPAGFWANVQALVTFYNTGATPLDLVDPDDPDSDIPFD